MVALIVSHTIVHTKGMTVGNNQGGQGNPYVKFKTMLKNHGRQLDVDHTATTNNVL